MNNPAGKMNKLSNELIFNKFHNVWLFIILLLFTFIFSLLTINSPQKFTAPDEAMGKYFTEKYSKTGSLQYYEPLSTIAHNYARPRNAFSKNSHVSPATFPGFFIVFGTVGAIAFKAIPFLTPVFAVMGGVFMYLLVLHTSKNKNISIFAVLLLFTLPPYWIWSSTTFFNNIASSVFLLGGILFFLKAVDSRKFGYYIISGCCYGVDCLFRTTDITYFIALLPIIYILRKKIVWRYLAAALASFILVVSPVFIMNKQLHGSFLSFGYDNSNVTSKNLSTFDKAAAKLTFFILPSGFHPGNILIHTEEYVVEVIPLISLFGIIGLIYLLREKTPSSQYSVYFIAISLWILIYYGSGVGFVGSASFTLFSSYIRYFLPIYIFIIPFAAVSISKLPRKVFIIFVPILMLTSILTSYSGVGGISEIAQARKSEDQKDKVILNMTENNSVVFTTLADKYIFPDRKVIIYGPGYPDGNYSTAKMASMIIALDNTKKIPIYVLNDRLDLNIPKLNTLLKKYNLGLEEKSDTLFLYKVVKSNE
jgi:hypothetical protein